MSQTCIQYDAAGTCYAYAQSPTFWDTVAANPILIVIWIGCAGLCAIVAKSKNRDVGKSIAAGLLLGFIGLIVYLCLSTKPAPVASQPEVKA